MGSIAEILAEAKRLHRTGRIAEAEPVYREALRRDPSEPSAWYLLGVACHGLGRIDDAIGALRTSLRLQPGHAEAHNYLGMVLARADRFEEAIGCFREAARLAPHLVEPLRNLALACDPLGRFDEGVAAWRRVIVLDPGSVDSHRALAAALRKQGRWPEAADALRAALRLRPDLVELLNDLGLVLEQQGDDPGAEASYRDAIRRRPDFPPAHNHLGALLAKRGDLEAGIAACREAIRLDPGDAGARNNLGVALERQERWAEAEGSYRAAARLDPGLVMPLYNLGSVLGKLARRDEGEACCRRALGLDPGSAEAHHNLAYLLAESGRLADAEAHYRDSIARRPDFVEALYGLGCLLGRQGRLDEAETLCRRAVALRPESPEARGDLGFVLAEQGRIAEALDCYREALRLRPDSPTLRTSYLFTLNYDPRIDAATLLDEHRRAGERLEAKAAPARHDAHDRTEARPLRVGYVSPDFRRHPVALFLEPILANHDPAQVVAIGYADLAVGDATTDRLRALCREWRDIRGLTDAETADLIRRDRVDILVDLAGHTAHHRLGVFARRPAPIQATYLGYPSTTGLTTIDYLFTDAVVDPEGEAVWSTEEPYRLPVPFCCVAPPDDAPEVSPLPALRHEPVTFGALHKLSKLNADVLDLWSDLLLAIPAARLLLFRNQLQGTRRAAIARHFEGRGIAADRVELRHAHALGSSHLAVYGEIDVALDVFPWSGHTTACEALWMGVPVVTLAGDRHAGRMTASVLTSLGMSDWIARTPEEYIVIARRHSDDREALARRRAGLRDRFQASSLGDGITWTRALEAAYRALWRRFCL